MITLELTREEMKVMQEALDDYRAAFGKAMSEDLEGTFNSIQEKIEEASE